MYVMPGARRLTTVAIMLIEPMIEDKPIKWTPKIKKVTVSGAYVVDSGA